MAIMIVMTGTMFFMLGALILSYNMAAVRTPKYLLGITLPENLRQEPQVQRVLAVYRRDMHRITLLGFLGVIFSLLLYQWISFLLVWLMFWFGGIFALYRTNAAKHAGALRQVKQTAGWQMGEQEDEYWLNGYPPGQKRSGMVSNRIGMGMTINDSLKPTRMEHGIGIAACIVVGAVALFLGRYDFASAELLTEGKQIRVQVADMGYSFDLEEVKAITLVEQRPDMSKSWGLDSNRYYCGDFRVEDYGKCKVYVSLRHDKVILVELTDQLLWFNAVTQEETESFYEELKGQWEAYTAAAEPAGAREAVGVVEAAAEPAEAREAVGVVEAAAEPAGAREAASSSEAADGSEAASAVEESQTVDIMFLHDTHSHLNTFSTVEEGQAREVGGFARIKTLIDAQKEKNPDTLLLDGGDFSMGTLIQVIFEEEASELRLLGALGFEATTLGNHEFDYKAKGLANMMNAAVESGQQLPAMVLCNVDWEAMEEAGLTEDQKLLREAFENLGVQDYIVLEKGGVKIAVTGVFGLDALDCTPNCPLVFSDPTQAVQETVARIQEKEDVDLIACVSHSGTWEDPEKSEDELLAKAVPQLDLIVSGHTHTRLEEPIVHGDTYIVSAQEYGKYLGSLSMTRQADGRWKLDSYELIPVDTGVEPDEDIKQRVEALEAVVDSKYLEQFGYTRDQVLCTNAYAFASSQEAGELHTELNLGSIMADAYTYMVDALDTGDPHPVDVAVVPAGVIRDTYTKGEITVEKVFNSFSLGMGADGIPGYPLISVYLTGAELKTVAEIDASISDFMTTARLYTDGLYWHYNPNRMLLNKVTDVYLCNADEERVELEDDTLYRVVTDFYTSQMLGGVTELSYGLLSLVPKHADGTPVTDYTDAIITVEGQELKAWAAIAGYLESFEDADGDGLGDVPAKYSAPEGRKVVEDSKKIGDRIKNPNKFFFMILGVIAAALLLVTVTVVLLVRVIRRLLGKFGGKSERKSESKAGRRETKAEVKTERKQE